jgi:hypothetical protein
MRSFRTRSVTAIAGALAAASPAFAQDTAQDEPDQVVNHVDLSASAGYSSNPFLRIGDSKGSGFVRATARGVHEWRSELSATSLSGFVEGSTYFNDYGLKSIFSVDARHSQRVSERVGLFGSVGASGDISGQLSSRFLYVPPGPNTPETPQLPPTVVDPDRYAFSGRQYRLYGHAGATVSVSERGNVRISGGAQRSFFSKSGLDDYTSIFAQGGYDHRLSERTSVGFGASVNRTEYDDSNDHSTIFNPHVTARTQLSEDWNAAASVGVSFAQIDRGATSNNSTNLSLDGSVCHATESNRFCGRVGRFAQNSAAGSLVNTSSVGFDWSRQFDASQSVQLSAGYVHFSEKVVQDDLTTDHFRFAGSYNRVINGRLSAGASVTVRALREDGPDPNNDVGGSVFLRYRLGNI